jgi:hypothetical protein
MNTRHLLAGAAIFALVGIPSWVNAYRTRRPADMRAENAVWVKAPVIFRFGQGWWLGCWIDPDQQSNRCRVYDPIVHPSIVYEGRYLACEGESPVPLGQLKIKSPHAPRDTLLQPAGVAVILQDGRLLVPAESHADCAKIRTRLADRQEIPIGKSP